MADGGHRRRGGQRAGIELRALRVVRDGRVVLDVPALAFAPGATTAVFGPNGSGKTTLLRCIAGLERPVAGEARIDGAPVVVGATRGRARIAYAFQRPVFVRGTVRANLALGLELWGVPPDERAERIGEVAAECGIDHLLDRSAHKLSGGESQRANLARALALRAPVTLLDEPLAGLDRAARTQLLADLPRLLERFAATTILVTHDREEAFRLADELVVLVEGRVRAAGGKRALLEHPTDGEVAALLGYTVVPVEGRLLAVPPGGLRARSAPGWGHGGEHGITATLTVERVLDLGHHLHVAGWLSAGGAADAATGVWADARLADGEPPPGPGESVTVVIRDAIDLPPHPEGARARVPGDDTRSSVPGPRSDAS